MSSLVPWQDARSKLEASGLVPLGRIEWPNEPMPNGQPGDGLWIAVRDIGDVLEPIELGGNGAWQETGRLYIEVMAPVGTGTTDARTLAKALTNVFRGLPPGPVTYLGGSIGSGFLAGEDGAWWTLPVSVNWRYTDILGVSSP